jgi:hypothetical protein
MEDTKNIDSLVNKNSEQVKKKRFKTKRKQV